VRERVVPRGLNGFDRERDHVIEVKACRIDRPVAEMAEASVQLENRGAIHRLDDNGSPYPRAPHP
jgi:hypothetical protein